jgi:phage-related protein
MAKAGTAEVEFTGDFDGLSKGLDDSTKKVESSFNDSFKRIAAFAAGALATIGIGKVLKDSFGEAEDAAKVAAQTQAVITSTGAAAGVSAQQVDDLATALSNKSAVDDEVIASGENVLLTFTNIKNVAGQGNDVFNQATEAALNMSAALGTDLQGNIVQVGKALNDPIKGITALSRVGVSFTEQQKEQIKTLQESGDTLGAQKVILAELSKEFSGAAEAAATPTQRLQTIIGNLEETLGGALIPVATKFGDILTKLAPKLSPLLDAIGELVGTLGGALADAFDAVLPAIQPLLPVITELVKTLAGGLGAALKAILPALGSLVTALAPLLPPIAQLANVLLGALADVIVQLATALTPVVQQLVVGLQPVLTELQPVIPQMAEAFLEIVKALLPLIPTLADLLVMLTPLIVAAIKWNATITALIAEAVTPLIAILTIVVNDVLKALMATIGAVIGVFTNFHDSLQALVGFFQAAWDTIKQVVQTALDAIVGFMRDLPGKAAGAIADFGTAVWNTLSSAWDFVKGKVGGAIDELIAFVKAIPGKAADAVITFGSEVWGKLETAWEDIKTKVSGKIDDVIGFIKDIPGKAGRALAGFFGEVVDKLVGPFKAAYDQISDWLDKLNALAHGKRIVTISPNIVSVNGVPVDQSATGRLATSPMLSTLAEHGPEAVLNNRQAARILWELANSPVRGAAATATPTRVTNVTIAAERPVITARDIFAVAREVELLEGGGMAA